MFLDGLEEVALVPADVEPFQWDAGEAERGDEPVPAMEGPEAARAAVVDVEGEEPVWQGVSSSTPSQHDRPHAHILGAVHARAPPFLRPPLG